MKTEIQNADFNGGERLDTATVRSGELFQPHCPGMAQTQLPSVGLGHPQVFFGQLRAEGFCPQPQAPSNLDRFTNLGWGIRCCCPLLAGRCQFLDTSLLFSNRWRLFS